MSLKQLENYISSFQNKAMNLGLNDRNYLVTGAASGIGFQVAKTLSECGCNVALADINEEALIKAQENINGKTQIICIDLTDSKSLKEKILESVKTFGRYHGFVHCAGLPYISPLRAINQERAEKVYAINTYSAIELAKLMSSPSVRAQSNCAFVLISSVYGLVGSSANAVYAATKGAIISLTKALAIELSGKRIRVNCVAPGFVKTNMLGTVSGSFDEDYTNNLEKLHPLGLGEAAAIAEPIAFLLSDAARWITGSVLSVDGGFTAQ